MRGKSWEALGDNEKASTFYRAAGEAGSSEIDFYLELAKAQEELNDSIGTLATLLRAYGLAPNNSGINYALGVQFSCQPTGKCSKVFKLCPDGCCLCHECTGPTDNNHVFQPVGRKQRPLHLYRVRN